MEDKIYPAAQLWRPSRLEKLILSFLPTYISEDDNEPWKYPVRLYYKKWRGRIYVMKEERTTNN